MATAIDKLRLAASLHMSGGSPTLPKRGTSTTPPALAANTSKADHDYTNYSEEWVKSREATDKFDGYLFDLRKYGFSILTGLITAGSFLGFAEATQFIQVGVIIVTMVLVVILYWLDIYYQGLLYGTVFRTRFLEIFRLNRALSIYISALYGASHIGRLLHYLYIGFLLGVFLLGYFVTNFATFAIEEEESPKNEAVNNNMTNSTAKNTTNEGATSKTTNSNAQQRLSDIKSNLNIALGIGLSLALLGILLIYILCDLKRTGTIKKINGLFNKHYESRENPEEVRKLEGQLNSLFAQYL